MQTNTLQSINMDTYRGALNTKNLNTKEGITETAQEIEALFINEMLKEMRKSNGTIFGKGLGADIYMGMFDTELSRVMAERGIGLKEMIVNQLSSINDETQKNSTGTAENTKDNRIPPEHRKNLKKFQELTDNKNGVLYSVKEGGKL
ncbi:flagellar rod assembly protein/muramidase FlgJ [Candidatus Magnetoovum chiemensis]|nr:flagellar rod assembly protein/muramidase FlgJ [Candidatus Magnetoovum chiemensis]